MTRSDDAAKRDGTPWAGLAGLLLLWFAAAYVIGAERLLAGGSPGLLRPIALTAVVPVAGFLALYALSPQFRERILTLDIATLTMLQVWRVVGFAFLPLYAFGVLPGLFAWPAGLGDVAIGLAAPFVVARLWRDRTWATSAGLVRFHLLGLVDFAIAIGTASLASGNFPGLLFGGVTSAAMEVWPLNLFPSFLVPIFIILHLAVLLQVLHMRRTVGQADAAAAGTA